MRILRRLWIVQRASEPNVGSVKSDAEIEAILARVINSLVFKGILPPRGIPNDSENPNAL